MYVGGYISMVTRGFCCSLVCWFQVLSFLCLGFDDGDDDARAEAHPRGCLKGEVVWESVSLTGKEMDGFLVYKEMECPQ